MILQKNIYFQHQDLFESQIMKCAKVYNNLVVLDLREEEVIYSGNRFVIYGLFPGCSVSIHRLWGINKEKNVFSVDCFTRTLNNNWYERCWYLAEKGYLFSGFYFLFLNPAFNISDLYDFIRLLLKSGISKFNSRNKL